jgi:glyoxylase-like metal-dependent hydrolase (beta-lactamase superfamily II)
MKLTEGLFSYLWENPCENNCNSYLVQGDRTILIDPGHSQFTDQLLKEMKADGFSPDHVDLILSTHCHPDHMEGLEAFLNTEPRWREPRGGTLSTEERKNLFESWEALPRYRSTSFLKMRASGAERSSDLSNTGHSPGSFSIYWKPEGPVHGRCCFLWRNWKDRFTGGKFQAPPAKHRKAISTGY